MKEKKIMVELFVERPNFAEVSKIRELLNASGINALIAPPDDRNINCHLIVEKRDIPKIRKKLGELGIAAIEKEILFLLLENRPGVLAEVTSRISGQAISITYAFGVEMDPDTSLLLLGTSNNQAALKSLP